MSKAPIYLLPGTLCTEQLFAPLMSQLREHGFHSVVVQFTQQRSIDEMVELAVKKMEKKPGIILGFSMGGIVALALAKKYPELVAKLVLMSTNYNADDPAKAAIREQHVAQAKESSLADVIERLYLPVYFERDHVEGNQVVLSMATELGVSCFEAQVQSLTTRENNLSVLESIQCPVLIIAGRKDKLCVEEFHLTMHTHCPVSDLVLVSGCGHFPLLEQPRYTEQSIVSWLVEKR
ncbi:alpha/beta hydrolase [Alteromonadaceae bacterium M269]|nr:alpha/beta hydrolase [Alteromonadaceae bacterium M269]